ncbi:hypothetical protein ABL78_1042 [Leptomonas seymouri]|uniref:Uncharacterized protein n=1 Tax=Leptomonas seymouri TaxID=5684 RepID=A0A0N1I9G8_LEPSE|nr:hypothetical protein ABL78_1042 [Leptomonas seymouri]|eukprot:KPI89873.1 hypothetical protein ABL78_1042 [Leptomonas seymouri]
MLPSHVVPFSSPSCDSFYDTPAVPTLQPVAAAALVLRCCVQFLYTAAAVDDSAPFATATAATVEVVDAAVSPSSLIATSELESGLHIRPLGSFSRNTSESRAALHSPKDDGGLSSLWDLTRLDSKRSSQDKLRKSVVKAVRRVPRDDDDKRETGTFQTVPPSFLRGKQRLNVETLPPYRLPFSSLCSLDWSFKEASPKPEASASAMGSTAPPTHSSTFSGASGSRIKVVGRLRCRSGTAVGHPPREVGEVLLSGLPCTDALALADAFDAAKQRVSASSNGGVQSAPQPLCHAEARAFVDPFAGLHARADEAQHQSSTDAPSPLAASDTHMKLRDKCISLTAAASAPSAAPGTLVRVPTSASSRGRSGAPPRHTRSISFTYLAGRERPPLGCGMQPPQRTKPHSAASSPSSRQTTAYNKYARMLGIDQSYQQPSQRSPSTLHSIAMGLVSLPSIDLGVDSVTETPLDCPLQFPRHNSACERPTPSEEKEWVSPDDPLSESVGVCSVPRQERRNGKADELESRCTQRGRGELHFLLPDTVDVPNGAPRWFPAAPELLGASEAMVPPTDDSVLHDGTAKALPVAPTAATAGTPSLPKPARHELPDDVPATADGGPFPLYEPSPTDARTHTVESTNTVAPYGGLHGSVLPPLPPSLSSLPTQSVSPPLAAIPVTVASAKDDGNAAPAFHYLTPAQRQLLNFDAFLRPIILPPDTAAAGPLTLPSSAPSAVAATPRATALDFDINALHPPAAFDQVLLKLRMSSLPTAASTTAKAVSEKVPSQAQFDSETPASASSLRAPLDAVPVLPSRQVESAVTEGAATPPSASQVPLTTLAKSPPSASITWEFKQPSAVSATDSNQLLSSYHEVLRKMLDRQVHVTPSTTASHAAIPAGEAASITVPSQTNTGAGVQSPTDPSTQEGLKGQCASDESQVPVAATLRTLGEGAPPKDAPQKGPGQGRSAAAAPRRGSTLPLHAHGPFAQPSRHPPCTFLPHSSRLSHAPSTSTPPRFRPLAALSELSVGGKHPQDSATASNAQTPSRGARVAMNRGESEVSSSLGSSSSPRSSLWRNARTSLGKDVRSPQSPPQMLPRRPEPLTKTSKHALDPTAGTELTSLSTVLANELTEEDGRPSSTSMAT